MQRFRQRLALVHEEVAEVGGGQVPQGVHAHVEAAHARVGGGLGDAVELEVGGAEALGDDGSGGRLANA